MRNLPTTRKSASVVIVGVDKAGMGMLRECLRAEAIVPPSAMEFDEAFDEVRRQKPNVVIVGFTGHHDRAVALGAQLQSDMPSLALVAYAEASNPDHIRQAMRAGFREYVVLPQDSDLLRQAVHDAAYSNETEEDRGEIIAVTGATGGSGVTSLSVNLAAELCPVHRVAVLDMDFSSGDVAAYLDLKPKRSISDLLREIDRLDERVLAGSMTVHPSKIHVLAQADKFDEQEEIKGEDVLRLLRFCANSYQYCLVDCGTQVDEATLTSLSVADMVFLLCTQDVPSVKNAYRRIQLFERLGIETSRVRLILNKLDRKPAKYLPPIAEIESHLKMRVAATVERDDLTLREAINNGRLVRDINRKSPTVADYSNMVTIITEGDEVVQPVEKKAAGRFSFLFE